MDEHEEEVEVVGVKAEENIAMLSQPPKEKKYIKKKERTEIRDLLVYYQAQQTRNYKTMALLLKTIDALSMYVEQNAELVKGRGEMINLIVELKEENMQLNAYQKLLRDDESDQLNNLLAVMNEMKLK
jgi:hypothetical protein